MAAATMHLQHETASSDIDEAGLVARAKAMDEGAWDYLLQSYYGRLQGPPAGLPLEPHR